MSGSLNKVTLICNLCADPEVKSFNNGGQVCNLNVATNETWKDKNSGERKSKAEYHKVVIFNEHLIKIAQQYLKKGSKVYLEGSLATRKWQDQSGADKYSTEVVLQKYKGELTMLDSKGDNQSGGGDYQQEKPRDALDDFVDENSDIPFMTKYLNA